MPTFQVMRRTCCLLLAAVGAAAGQERTPHAHCRDPHPAPVCESYLLFEYNGALRQSGTTINTARGVKKPLDSWFAWDVGWMKNRTPTSSLGGALEVGGSGDGVRVALRAKSRHWLPNDFAFDMSAGPLMAQYQTGDGERPTFGITGDVGFGRARWVLLTGGFDMARQNSAMQVATHVGGRAESTMVVIISAVAAIGGILVASALGSLDR
jgi:hypothetical protein